MDLEKWFNGIFILSVAYYCVDIIFLQKRRIKKQRKELVDGIIADLKKSDQVMAIDSVEQRFSLKHHSEKETQV